MNLIEIKKQNQPAIQGLSNLATAILKENYDPIIGVRQNDYMLKKFQSVQALTEQCEQNYRYFFVSDKDNKNLFYWLLSERK